MLLTIPWFLSIVGGRVDLNPETGMPNYKSKHKLSPENANSFTGAGIKISKAVNSAAWIVIGTSIGYFLLQVPGLVYLNKTTEEQAAGERNWVIFGLFLATIFFFAYLYQQYRYADTTVQELKQEEALRTAIANGKITLSGYMVTEYHRWLESRGQSGNENDRLVANENTPLKTRQLSIPSLSNVPEEFIKHLERIVKPFFKVYDRDNNNQLDFSEMKYVFNDLGETNITTDEQLKSLFDEFDVDHNDQIDYQEFVLGVAKYVTNPSKFVSLSRKSEKHRRSKSTDEAVRTYVDTQKKTGEEEDGDDGDDDEEEDIPDDLKGLSPEEMQHQIKIRSFLMMAWGTFVVLFFSDPMVDVLSEVGTRTGIPAFYVAFIAAPLASNASELIASYNYAQKKTATTISIALSTLEGAAIMNNTFVLGKIFSVRSKLSLNFCFIGIFMFLIWYQSLAWEYFAETLSILCVELVVALYAMKNKHTLVDACIILALYPISLSLVAGLEYVGWN
jgi:Ca2+/Na+ antiporter